MEEEMSSDPREQPREEVSREPLALVLKRRREEKGLSLQASAAATRVPLRYLQHLEGGIAPHLLSEELYLVPFLRTYAAFLDLNPSSAVAEFIVIVRRREMTGGAVEKKTPPPRRLLVGVLVVLLILVGLGLLAWFWTSAAPS